MTRTRVLLVDDHDLVRAGLRALVSGFPDVDVVGEASTGRGALAAVQKRAVDVVLMDLAMPDLNGLETTARMAKAAPDVRVIILSMHASEEHALQALRDGAAGYLLKDSSAAELEQAIRTVREGRTFLTPKIATLIADYVQRTGVKETPGESLSPRQKEILQLIGEGKGTKEIAVLLQVSVKTVETHRAKLMEKLGIHEIAGLVRYAIEKGVVPLGNHAQVAPDLTVGPKRP